MREVVSLAAALGVLFYALTQGKPAEGLVTLLTSAGALFIPRLRDFARVRSEGGLPVENA